MKIDGYSDYEIQREMGVSERNYRRLHDKACAEEHAVIVQQYVQHPVRAMALLKARLEELYRIDMDIARIPDIDLRHLIKATKVAGEPG